MRKRKHESNDHEKDGETGRPREKDGNESSSSSSEQDSNEKHSDASETDEDDTPIYKLRRRNQTIMDYRFNDYDDLINSAINRSAAESTEQAPRGKDIRNIVEAEKKEKETERRSSSNSPVVEKKITQKTASSKKKEKVKQPRHQFRGRRWLRRGFQGSSFNIGRRKFFYDRRKRKFLRNV